MRLLKRIALFCLAFLAAALPANNQDQQDWPKSWPPELVESLHRIAVTDPTTDIERYIQGCSSYIDVSKQIHRTEDGYRLAELSDDMLNRLDLFSFSCWERTIENIRDHSNSENLASKAETVLYAMHVHWLVVLAREDRVVDNYNALVKRYNALVGQYSQLADNSLQLRLALSHLQADNAFLRANQQLLAVPRPTSLSCTATTVNYGYGFERTQLDCH